MTINLWNFKNFLIIFIYQKSEKFLVPSPLPFTPLQLITITNREIISTAIYFSSNFLQQIPQNLVGTPRVLKTVVVLSD